MTAALKALGGGLARVVASPQILVAAFAAMLIIAAPFTLVVAADLKAALNTQPPVNLDAGEIDPEWWFEYRQHVGERSDHLEPFQHRCNVERSRGGTRRRRQTRGVRRLIVGVRRHAHVAKT
jgi:hypothetical protein